MKDRRLLIIFLTIFIDLIGFGIIIPLSPYLASQYGANELQVGILQAVFSLMQFVFAPFWGRLSDIHGRRPILLISIAGGVFAYALFAFAESFAVLLLARSLAGFFGANISAAAAYIADITPQEKRSQSMGLIGAAFGLGFVFGPVLGGLLSHAGGLISEAPPFGVQFAALGASVLCLLNFIFAFLFLKESRSKLGLVEARQDRLKVFAKNLKRPVVGSLLITLFCSGLAMAHMESMLFIYVKEVFGWSLQQASFGFAFVGISIAFTQGFLIRKLLPRFGEKKLMFVGYAMMAVGIFSLGFSTEVWQLAVFNLILAIGVGMSNPSNLGSISNLTPASEQGSISGVTQSAAALGRIIGPVSGGYLYHQFGPSSPFVAGGLIIALGLILLFRHREQIPSSGLKRPTQEDNRPQSVPVEPTHRGLVVAPRPRQSQSPFAPTQTAQPTKFEATSLSRQQFQNLISQPLSFGLFDLRNDIALAARIPKARPVAAEELVSVVKEQIPQPDYPIVVICADGRLSAQMAEELAGLGYKNVHYLSGGVASST